MHILLSTGKISARCLFPTSFPFLVIFPSLSLFLSLLCLFPDILSYWLVKWLLFTIAQICTKGERKKMQHSFFYKHLQETTGPFISGTGGQVLTSSGPRPRPSPGRWTAMLESLPWPLTTAAVGCWPQRAIRPSRSTRKMMKRWVCETACSEMKIEKWAFPCNYLLPIHPA